MMNPHFDKKLEKVLQEHQLPGQKAQMLMAPVGRNFTPETKNVTDAAVLLVLFPKESDWYLILTRRQDYDGPHSGQISFPGGKKDPGDKDLTHTALRESHEEIGLKTDIPRIIGELTPLYIPVSKFLVHPIVAVTGFIPDLRPDPQEVRYIIEISLKGLLYKGNRKTRQMRLGTEYYTIPYFDLQGETVWGATAMILSEFCEILQSLY